MDVIERDPAQLVALFETACHEQIGSVEREVRAAEAVSELRDCVRATTNSPLDQVAAGQVIDLCLERLRAHARREQRVAAHVLGAVQTQEERVAESLLAAATATAPAPLLRVIVDSLGELRVHESTAYLTSLVDHEDDHIRLAVAAALAACADEDDPEATIPALLHLASDDESDVRSTATQGLAHMWSSEGLRDERVDELLLRGLKSSDIALRSVCVAALGSWRPDTTDDDGEGEGEGDDGLDAGALD